MNTKILFLYFICLVIGYNKVSGQILEAIEAVNLGLDYVSQFYGQANKIYNLFSKKPEEEENLFIPVLNQLKEIKDDVDNLGKQVLKDKIQTYMVGLNSRSFSIDNRYKEGRKRYYYKFDKYDRESMKDFAKQVTDRNVGIRKDLEELYRATVIDGKDSLLSVLNENYETLYECKEKSSKQRYFYNLMVSVLSDMGKAIALVLYSFTILEKVYNETYAEDAIDFKSSTDEWLNDTIDEFYKVMCQASRVIQKCDLQKNHAKGTTYIELGNVFQLVLLAQRDLNPDILITGNCPAVNRLSPIGVVAPCEETHDCFLHQQKCNNLVDCRKSADYDVCVAPNQSHRHRYLYVIDYQNYGYTYDCTNQKGYFEDFQEQHSAYVAHLGTCLCICDEVNADDSDRYFSLEDVQADVKSNYVVTGVRFAKSNQTINIEIQEGQLLPYGLINETSVKWSNKSFPKKKDMITGYKVHRISWYDQRGIFLDDIEFYAKDEIITGVRFATETLNNEVILKLEVQTTIFNFTSGQLYLETSDWYSNQHTQKYRNIFDVGELDSPLNIDAKHEVDSEKYSSIRFVPTDLKLKDAGSATIPFLDIQAIYSEVPAPLSGIRLQRLKAENSGGYIALAVKTFDSTLHIY